MSYATDHLAAALKSARERKGLSQRGLSKLAGVPQGHISKIENGIVDLRLSSLVELARVLHLELALVPRQSLAAVQSIIRSAEKPTGSQGALPPGAERETKRLQKNITALTQEHPGTKEVAQLARQIRELQHLSLAFRDVGVLREANKALSGLKGACNDVQSIRQMLKQIQDLRIAIMHSRAGTVPVNKPRPAYSLEEDDHG